MYCPHCGAAVFPSCRFCPSCGQAIGSSTASPTRHDRTPLIVSLVAVLGVVLVLLIVLTGLPNASQNDNGGNTVPAELIFDTTAATLEPGNTLTLGITEIPQNVDRQQLIWTSSDPAIATVDSDGKVTAICSGTAKITASYGNYLATCTITVTVSTPDTITNYALGNHSEAVLGKGFLDNPDLALTFNTSGYLIVTAPGLHDSYRYIYWTVADAASGETVIYQLGDTNTVNFWGECAQIFVWEQPRYGNYVITATYMMNTSTAVHAISGNFEYRASDGTSTIGGTFVRCYDWTVRAGGIDRTYDMSVTYSGSDYWEKLTSNAALFDQNTLSNYRSYANISRYLSTDETTAALSAALAAEYRQMNGADISVTDAAYAQYILAFVQEEFTYAYDFYQNGNGSFALKDRYDYWSYAIETIYTGCGDCEDTSILCAMLLAYAGYPAAVGLMPGHAIGMVALDGYSPTADATHAICTVHYAEKTYYGCETTKDAEQAVGITDLNTVKADIKIYPVSL